MKHSMAEALAKEICGPKAFTLLSTNGGKLAYRICLRGGPRGFNVWCEGLNWDQAIILAREKMRAFVQSYDLEQAPRLTSSEGQALLAAKLGDASSANPGGPTELRQGDAEATQEAGVA